MFPEKVLKLKSFLEETHSYRNVQAKVSTIFDYHEIFDKNFIFDDSPTNKKRSKCSKIKEA